ncbi:hypothetical protein [Streptomyces sp. NPDC015414]|uniref:hypothetical protein n=1 Tax=Streptomyces sp. NPDC015414 TaxID=3364957 RepID=UPI0036F79699
MAHPTRTYLVTNPDALFHPDERITFHGAAPAGTVVRHLVAGRLVRVLLTGTPLPGRGDVLAADLQAYL